MKHYRLITNKEWQELQKPLDNSLKSDSDNPFPQKVIDTTEFKKVKYQYNQHLNEIVQYCVKYQEECKNLYPTLEKLGLYYGTNTYNKDDMKLTAALIEAISSERAILLEKPVEYHSGLLPPQNNFLKLPSNRMPRRLTASEIQARQLAQYDNEENYIEFTVYNLANQPFTIFDNASQKMLSQGTLDSSGYAYVSLPVNAQYVDIVFDKQQTDRPWYYDVPLQLLGGVRDAGQSVSDLAWDASIAKQLTGHSTGVESANPIQLPKVPEAETVSGALAHGVSQFLVGFIPASKGLKVIKPLTRMGKFAQSMVAGGVADFAVFAPHEERLSNLVQSFEVLQNPVTAYLQASPDDGAAEGRLKNALEGLLLGALTEPFAHSLRALKYARIKWMISDVKTQVHYKLEIVTIETESGSKGNWNKALNNPEPNRIYIVDGNKIYHTDELGRLKQVDAELKLDTLDRNTYQQLKAGKLGIEGDEGGHLIASILNGSGEKINMLPMNANLNRGAWKQMENKWVKALEDGKTVKVKIEPVYNSSGVRPDKFKVKYSIDNGRSIEKILINAPGGI